MTPNYLAQLATHMEEVAAKLERDAARLPGRRSVLMVWAAQYRTIAEQASRRAQGYVAPVKEWAT